MRSILDLIETTERRALEEAARAPLYHATGLAAAANILSSGQFRSSDDHGWHHYQGKKILPVTRDERYRYSGAGYQDEVNNPVSEGGHGPVQFVLDADAIRHRYRVKPYDMAQGRFNISAKPLPPDHEDYDEFAQWHLSNNARRKESEERVELPKNGVLPIDGIVKAVILEPITLDWLHFHHGSEDRPHLVGSGAEKDFDYASKANRYNDYGERMHDNEGRDFTGVSPKIYHRIISLAKQRGIPVIDRRKR